MKRSSTPLKELLVSCLIGAITFYVLPIKVWGIEGQWKLKSDSNRNPSFSLRVNAVLKVIPLMVVDERGVPYTGLQKNDFTLTAQGRTLRINSFASAENAPLSLAILLDASASMGTAGSFETARTVITRLVEGLSEVDTVGLFTFRDYHVHKRVAFTTRKEEIVQALEGIRLQGETALLQALSFMPSLTREALYRRVIVVISDGRDTSSIVSSEQVTKAACQDMLPIFTFFIAPRTPFNSLKEKKAYLTGRSVLQTISHNTGGTFYSTDVLLNGDHTWADPLFSQFRAYYLIGVYLDNMPSDRSEVVSVQVPGVPCKIKTLPWVLVSDRKKGK